MNSLTYRYKLEKQIIGTCLICNCFDKVASILSPKNFSTKNDHDQIWKMMHQIYASGRSISLQTVSITSKAHYLCECTLPINNSATLIHDALMLLECDIREKVSTRLHDIRKGFISKSDFENASIIQEMYQAITDLNNDCFLIMSQIINYLNSDEQLKDISEELAEFKDAIPQKVKYIKDQAHITRLFAQLELLSKNLDPIRSVIISRCEEIVKATLIDARLSDDLLPNLQKLKITA